VSGRANPALCSTFQAQGKTFVIAAFGTGCANGKTWPPKLARRAPARSAKV
jgi:hypothetical protein